MLLGGTYDPLEEHYIIKAVSKLNATIMFRGSPSGLVLTREALRALLCEYRARYYRIFAIADFHYCHFHNGHISYLCF
jgi:aspartate/methionine/tyrosine aminotransferase